MRKLILAGNWKMNNGPAAAETLARGLVDRLANTDRGDVVLAPPFVSLAAVGHVIAGSRIALAAQDLHWEDSGAYTGAISAPMLGELGCEYVIVGHSERRQLFGETDEDVNRKIGAALTHDLTPIVCVGETLAEREGGQTHDRVEVQVRSALAGLTEAQASQLVLAYEPIWAIGTGRTASAEQAQDVHAFIRTVLTSRFSSELADRLRIQYGGSVKPSNVAQLMAQPDIDGALVGGASLNAESFANLVLAGTG